MGSGSTDARLKHLENASLCLLVSSPAISAHLQAERNSTIGGGDHETNDPRTYRSCTACGTILIPAWSCQTLRDVGKYGTGRPKGQIRAKKLRCSACGAETMDDRPRRTDKPRNPESRNSLKAPGSHTIYKRMLNKNSVELSQPRTDTAKASNRRTRSKKSSLQSMLENQKKTDSEKPKGFGMDLADLMQR